MATSSFWRGPAPVWLRILAGLLLFPILWLVFQVLLFGLFPAVRGLTESLIVLLSIIAAGIAAEVLIRKSSMRRALVVSSLALLAFAMGSLALIGSQRPSLESRYEGGADPPKESPDMAATEPPGAPPDMAAADPPGAPPDMAGAEPPLKPVQPLDGVGAGQPGGGYHYEISPELGLTETPAAEAPGPDLGAPSGGGGSAARPTLPEFPWPPPAASASYVLPDKLFESYPTLGDVSQAILAALEQNGYVERSFFRTAPGGVALVTRLERINDDGSPSAENERWTAAAQRLESTRSLLDLLHGLFFVDPGHYRVIVFVLQDLPFSQSAETITAQQAHAWLASGANVLSPDIAALPFAGGHVTVLIYEFASDGSKVQVVTSQLTGKQHLEKAGLLTVLDKVQ